MDLWGLCHLQSRKTGSVFLSGLAQTFGELMWISAPLFRDGFVPRFNICSTHFCLSFPNAPHQAALFAVSSNPRSNGAQTLSRDWPRCWRKRRGSCKEAQTWMKLASCSLPLPHLQLCVRKLQMLQFPVQSHAELRVGVEALRSKIPLSLTEPRLFSYYFPVLPSSLNLLSS